jgi:hypothetical protein
MGFHSFTFFTIRHPYCPDQSLPHLLTGFLKIHFNIILPCTNRYLKWLLSLRFPQQIPICAFRLPHICYVHSLNRLHFVTRIFGEEYRSCLPEI